jgi:hypothetical protein
MSFIDFFGIGKMPWIMRIYMLLFVCLLAALGLASHGVSEKEIAFYNKMESSFELVLGALLGALTTAYTKTRGSNE